jgi:DNA-binding LacI/PurR family transcriptional regulator
MPPSKFTMRSIAALARVSVSTVSRALRRDPRISADVGDRIRKLAADSGYQPNPHASFLANIHAQNRSAFRGVIAAVGGHKLKNPWKQMAHFRSFLAGASRRAESQHFRVDPFWLYSPGMRPERLENILLARNVAGVMLACMDEDECPWDWSKFSVAALKRIATPSSFHYVHIDIHDSFFQAFRATKEHGYSRIGCVVPAELDRRNQDRLLSVVTHLGGREPLKQRVPPLECPVADIPSAMSPWLKKYRPEVVIGFGDEVAVALRECGARIPHDVAFVNLDRADPDLNQTGVDPHYETLGAAAVDSVIEQIYHGERGVPTCTKGITVPGTWVEGSSMPRLPVRTIA